MIKLLSIVGLVFLLTSTLVATPPKPNTFVTNRGVEPSMKLATYMKANISQGIRDVIVVWNRKYPNPSRQISDLNFIFKSLTDTPKVPKQVLLNKEYEIYRVLNTKKLINALDRLQTDINKAYKALFEYSSVIIGTVDGSMDKRYNKMLSTMQTMVNSYNNLAKVSNKEYKQNYLPYYRLNSK